MIHLQKILPLALLLGLGACADTRVTKMDLQRNSYEITPLVSWDYSTGNRHGVGRLVFGGYDDELKQDIKDAAAGLCGPGGVEVLDVERPAYILVPLAPRGYLHCR